jgi:prepilin-type N-terminal cleavage/methylation domain-containing protein
MFRNINRGFSLIELLFVIAVLGLLSTTAILFYQQRMQTQKIEKTVAQMGQWLQAGMAYYVKYKKWPLDATTLSTEGYMPPNSAQSNPWCNTVPCYAVSVQGQLFIVTATTNMATQFIRDRIAARLPYGVVSGTDVIATVNVPLAAIERNPDVILMNMVPFTLTGNDFTFGSDRFDMTKEIPIGGKVPNCRIRYGENYRFFSYVIVTGYSLVKPQGAWADWQHPVMSDFSFGVSERAEGELMLGGYLKLQGYRFRGSGLEFVDATYAELSTSLKNDLILKGQAFLLCCRDGVACAPT